MSLEKDVIKQAVDKKFTDFSNSIKAELHSKLKNHEVINNYANSIDTIGELKTAFAEINKVSEE